MTYETGQDRYYGAWFSDAHRDMSKKKYSGKGRDMVLPEPALSDEWSDYGYEWFGTRQKRDLAAYFCKKKKDEKDAGQLEVIASVA